MAAACGNPDCFKELVKAHADVNVQVHVYTLLYLLPCLMYYYYYYYYYLLLLLNSQDSKSGKSALHYLIEKGDLPLTGFLITEVTTHNYYLK